MPLQEIIAIAAGFCLLTLSSRVAVKSLVKISRHFSIPEFVISFLLVGVIAILPELSIGINSALAGSPNFGLGIVFGSNIADLTLVLGTVALASGGLKVHQYSIRNVWLFLFSVTLPVLLLLDGEISRIDGLVLLLGFITYVFIMLYDRNSWPHNHSLRQSADLPFELITVLVALAALFFAGDIVTNAAQSLSALAGIPIFFLGTIVAVGTCLPELNFAPRLQGKNMRIWG